MTLFENEKPSPKSVIRSLLLNTCSSRVCCLDCCMLGNGCGACCYMLGNGCVACCCMLGNRCVAVCCCCELEITGEGGAACSS